MCNIICIFSVSIISSLWTCGNTNIFIYNGCFGIKWASVIDPIGLPFTNQVTACGVLKMSKIKWVCTSKSSNITMDILLQKSHLKLVITCNSFFVKCFYTKNCNNDLEPSQQTAYGFMNHIISSCENLSQEKFRMRSIISQRSWKQWLPQRVVMQPI